MWETPAPCPATRWSRAPSQNSVALSSGYQRALSVGKRNVNRILYHLVPGFPKAGLWDRTGLRKQEKYGVS